MWPFSFTLHLYVEKSATSGFRRIHGLRKRGLWSRLLCVVGDFWWKQVLKSSHALKKLWMHGKREFTKSLKASVPQFRIWLLLVLSTPSERSMRSAQWSSSASEAYLFTHEIFKDKKKERASMKFRPPSLFGPYRMSLWIQFLLVQGLVVPLLIKKDL